MHYFAAITTLAGLAAALPHVSHVVHEKRDGLPVAWDKHSRADADLTIPVRIGLKQRNLEEGARLLHDISDPDSANFGNESLTRARSARH